MSFVCHKFRRCRQSSIGQREREGKNTITERAGSGSGLLWTTDWVKQHACSISPGYTQSHCNTALIDWYIEFLGYIRIRRYLPHHTAVVYLRLPCRRNIISRNFVISTDYSYAVLVDIQLRSRYGLSLLQSVMSTVENRHSGLVADSSHVGRLLSEHLLLNEIQLLRINNHVYTNLMHAFRSHVCCHRTKSWLRLWDRTTYRKALLMLKMKLNIQQDANNFWIRFSTKVGVQSSSVQSGYLYIRRRNR